MLRHGFLVLTLWAVGCWSFAADPTPSMAVYSLQQAIDQAFLTNHQYHSLLNHVVIAQLDYEKARSVFKTKLKGAINTDARSGVELGSTYNLGLEKKNLSGSSQRVDYYHASFGGKELSEVRFSYTLPFFQDPIANGQFDVDRAELDLKHHERLSKIAAEELVLNVISAYYARVLAEKKIGLAEGELAVAKRLQTGTHIRARSGQSSELDLQRAELRVSQAEQQLLQARFHQRKAEYELTLVMGVDGSEPLSVVSEIPVLAGTEAEQLTVESVLSEAMSNRAELLKLSEDLALARRKLTAVPVRRSPGVNVSLQYSLVGEGNSYSDSMRFNDSSVGVGISMDIDLMGTPDQQHRRLTLFYDTTLRKYQRLEFEIQRMVMDAVLTMKTSQSQLDFHMKSLALAKKQFQMTELTYRHGKSSTQEVLEAEQQLSDALHTELSSRVSYLLAGYHVKLIAGTLMADWRAGSLQFQ